ncbi:MAG: bifunctional 23S rRNA (guanine(2069)-N(7))-methyltransferase RlmK/23S rRNA (guanine(2445)-N(2))-methyltransferase RlmL [Coriobacteriia bacterium]|nr:bifunctional 23S rRNA (guanine(2069)-N(7))-methyltransferase RlmK/23S rRNA (guanine(2445)-N(2))-methyltransferase RlmL [Coriobacteriia bacterium]
MPAPFTSYPFFVTCATGLEPLLADEMRAMRTHSVRPQHGGVLFTGTIKDAYRICLWSRLASRVLLSLGEVDATSAETLYAGVKAMPWEEHMRATGTLVVQSTGVNESLRNTQFTNVKVKDAVADRFREMFNVRPNVDPLTPELTINVLIMQNRAKISIDLAGEPLHKRGYRQDGVQVVAPMKETLAAAMLLTAGWPEIAAEGGPLVDFMCGSGTLLVEGAMIAGDIAPGLLRRRWGFSKWLKHDEEAWDVLLDEANNRRAQGADKIPPIVGSDYDARSIEIARRVIRRARLDTKISLARMDLRAAQPPLGFAHPGLVTLNPPYGERLASTDEVVEIYLNIAEIARLRFDGWTLAIISPDSRLSATLALNPTRVKEFYNGRILSPVSVYRIGEAQEVAAPESHGFQEDLKHPLAFGGKGEKTIAPKFDIDPEPFKNRLEKMKKHYEKWARKAGISCYRIYDADLPDFNCAIDIYRGVGISEGRAWVHVAEYAPPADVDPRLAAARMEIVREVCSEVFDAAQGDLIVKQRKRQRGSSQYERTEQGQIVGFVEEGGLTFEVNLTEYLDTGIFLDHRDVRAMIRASVKGKTFLNLFAYTGVVSVFAAAGGAHNTTTVDMSKTYLDAARRNMQRNNLLTDNEAFEQADVTTWVDEAIDTGRTFDMIFCDPPTFSNSKRMDDTWDVVRDHADLLIKLGKILSTGGEIIFSCNKHGFKIDVDSLKAANLEVEDITKRTMPRDFERNTHIHKCYKITHES